MTTYQNVGSKFRGELAFEPKWLISVWSGYGSKPKIPRLEQRPLFVFGDDWRP